MRIDIDYNAYILDSTFVINHWLAFPRKNDFYYLLNLIKDHGVNEVIISNIKESWHTFGNTLGKNEWIDFYKFCKSIDVEFKFILGTMPPNEYVDLSNNFYKVYKDDCYFYPFVGIDELQSNKTKLLKENNVKYNQKKYNFSCLIGKARPHRIILFDFLSKYNLVSNNVVSFLDDYPNEIDYKDWLYIDNFNTVKYDYTEDVTAIPVWKLPDEYFYSYLDIVPETSYDFVQYTEKTFKSIFFKKPFIIYGGSGSNLELKNMGFELYDELFDYDYYDTSCGESDIIKSDYISSFLRTFNTSDYCNDTINEKTEHNYKTLLKYKDRFFYDISRKKMNVHDFIENKNIIYNSIDQCFDITKKLF